MDPTGKKVSFGFSKLTKKPGVIFKKPAEEKKIELVESFEGQSIKIKDAVELVFVPLVIPINDSKKNLLDRIKEAKAKQKESVKKEVKEEVDTRPDSELTIDELAARELIREAKSRLSETDVSTNTLVLPTTLENDKEPTIEDYESIPISEFGKAMLRGMGWKEETSKSKDGKADVPELRPKGLGLGANKLVKAEQKAAVDKDGKELILIKGAFAKVIAGAQKGNYCEVQGLDDEAGRVIVKTSLKGEILTLNEFLLVPVTKEEYAKGCKILNNAKYEEYLEISDRQLEKQRRNKVKEETYNSDEDVKNNKCRDRKKSDEEYEIKKEKDDYGRDKPRKNYASSDSDNHGKSAGSSRNRNYEIKKEKNTSSKTNHSDSDDFHDSKRRNESKDRSRRRSRSKSSEDDRSRRRTKKDKSKHRDRSRSNSEEESYRRSKKKTKSKSRNRSSSRESVEYVKKKEKKSKKNKCKSRHRRSSSSESDRKTERKGKK